MTVIHTSGTGLWSNSARAVKLSRLSLSDDYPSGGAELRAYFRKRDWDVSRHGLIYTDPLWIREFRVFLVSRGFPKRTAAGVSYSEQGMQGDDYVSLDVTRRFARVWNERALDSTVCDGCGLEGCLRWCGDYGCT